MFLVFGCVVRTSGVFFFFFFFNDTATTEIYTLSLHDALPIFAAIERQGGLSIASLPEYWRNHWDDLGAFVVAGVDGFEIVNCAPQALAFPTELRRAVLTLAGSHDLLVVGASDNHGWGKVTCVWNVSRPGAQGFHTNRVFARPLALLQ